MIVLCRCSCRDSPPSLVIIFMSHNDIFFASMLTSSGGGGKTSAGPGGKRHQAKAISCWPILIAGRPIMSLRVIGPRPLGAALLSADCLCCLVKWLKFHGNKKKRK